MSDYRYISKLEETDKGKEELQRNSKGNRNGRKSAINGDRPGNDPRC